MGVGVERAGGGGGLGHEKVLHSRVVEGLVPEQLESLAVDPVELRQMTERVWMPPPHAAEQDP